MAKETRGNKMKTKIWFYLIFMIIFLYHSATLASKVKTYRNNELGFEISYPTNWEKSTSPGNPAFFIKRKSTTEIGTISIHVKTFTGNKAEKFMREMKSNPDHYTQRVKKNRLPDAEMVEHGDTYLGGFPAYFYIMTYSLRNLNKEIGIVTMQIFCVKGDRLFLVNFETQWHTFEKVFSEFKVILSTFNFR
jgi:hypothetical protein